MLFSRFVARDNESLHEMQEWTQLLQMNASVVRYLSLLFSKKLYFRGLTDYYSLVLPNEWTNANAAI